MATKINNKGFGIVEVLIILSVIAILVLAGAFFYERHNKNNTVSAEVSAGTQLTIKRDNTLNQLGVSNFSKTVSHSSAVAILSDINSLKPTSQGSFSCPNDDGVVYILSFTNPTLSATASATGCQFVSINNKSYQSTDKFWKDVSNATQQPIDPYANPQ